MINSSSKNVMIDPSLIVARWTCRNTFDLIGQLSENGFDFYLPASFFIILEYAPECMEHPVYRFSIQKAQPAEFSMISHAIKEYSHILRPFEISQEQE